MITVGDFLGLVGVTVTLIAYLLLNMRKISSEKLLYPLLNAIGSVLIISSLICDWNLAAFVMELAWLLISVYGATAYVWRREYNPAFSAEILKSTNVLANDNKLS